MTPKERLQTVNNQKKTVISNAGEGRWMKDIALL
jgi:hypothetical protein